MKYYKVVDSYLCSIVTDITDLGIQYKVGEWVYPKNSAAPLMVFSNLESAIGFCVNGADQVFECEIKKSRKKWGWVNRWCRRQAFKQIKNKKKYTDFIQDNMLPKSTVLADSVKLLKRVN